MPSANEEIDLLRRSLVDLLKLEEPVFRVSSLLEVRPLASFSPPLPIGSTCVGSGDLGFPVKPSVWLNPFVYLNVDVDVLDAYLWMARLRPDLSAWLAPLSSSSVLVCDMLVLLSP